MIPTEFGHLEVEKPVMKISSDGFAPLRDIFIETDKGRKSHYKSEHLDLIIDTGFNARSAENVVQDGVVAYAPPCSSINKGDKVYTHHFLTTVDDNEYEVNGDMCYRIGEDSVYCRVDGDGIKMMDGFSLLSPVKKKPVSDIIISPSVDNETNLALLEHPSPELKHLKGKRVYFVDNADYDMQVEGETFFCIADKHIIAWDDDGAIVPLGDYILAEKYVQDEFMQNGIYIPATGKLDLHKSEVLSVGEKVEEVSGGCVVYYPRGRGTVIGDSFLIREEEVLLFS